MDVSFGGAVGSGKGAQPRANTPADNSEIIRNAVFSGFNKMSRNCRLRSGLGR